VCPKGAIEHSGLDTNQIRKIDKGKIHSDGYEALVLGRRSIRQYKDTPVPGDIIERIIELARYSPTASNKQDVAYTVITDPAILKEISIKLFGFGERVYGWMHKAWGKAVLRIFRKTDFVQTLNAYKDSMEYYIRQTRQGRDFILHHAPVLLLIHGPKSGMFSNDNCAIASTHIINYAYSLGLGTCYIGYLTLALRWSPSLRRRLNVPKGSKVFISLVMGYPQYSHSYTVSRNQPAVTWL